MPNFMRKKTPKIAENADILYNFSYRNTPNRVSS